MAELLRISEDVYQKVPGLIIIAGILEIGAPMDLKRGFGDKDEKENQDFCLLCAGK